VEEFFRLAPAPWPLTAGSKWHIFLSYRSMQRKWVLGLYDILTQLKYQVFMDQFVLVAGQGLASSLGDNLDASEAGILMWSARSEDSAWCKKEYCTFESREFRGDFKFVAIRLNNAPLPGFVQGTLWIDCSEERDGLSGMSLLRLLHGLQGQPLPEQAVRLATHVDDAARKDMAAIRTAASAKQVHEIVKLAAKHRDDLAWRFSPALSCAAAQALISVGSPHEALRVLDSVRANFPAAIRPRQLTGLALARSGDWKQAKAVFGELYELGERDPETVGMYARTWMDAYYATGDRLLLRRSRDLYAESFASAPENYYTGINAASKSIFLDEVEAGMNLGKQVEALVGTREKPGDYWQTATVAEVQLIQRNYAEAASLYEKALAIDPGAVDDHRSTCKQARLLLKHLDATPEQVSHVLGVFRRHIRCPDARSAVESVRGQGRARIVTFTGFSGTGYEDEALLRDLILEELEAFSPADTLVCAGATPEGIGVVYTLALHKGFRTAGIVSSLARAQGAKYSNECEVVFEVEDKGWGGKQENGRLAPTSQATVDASDVMIGIGGGAIARDELEEARARGKNVRFHRMDMNHALATQKAADSGHDAPSSFGGEAQALFVNEHGPQDPASAPAC